MKVFVIFTMRIYNIKFMNRGKQEMYKESRLDQKCINVEEQWILPISDTLKARENDDVFIPGVEIVKERIQLSEVNPSNGRKSYKNIVKKSVSSG